MTWRASYYGALLDTSSPSLTMKTILAAVAANHDLTVERLIGPERHRTVSWARQEAMWWMWQVRRDDGTRRYTTTQIGMACGGRDHTTAIWGIRRHAERLACRIDESDSVED